jgi:hypothetical protein
MAGVAQLVRASGCGSEGRGFDPRRLPHLLFQINPRKILHGNSFFCSNCIFDFT